MQTFLPYSDFVKSAKVLDWKRLGKQRVEGLTILNILSPDYDKKGWKNHPIVKMWTGYDDALKLYTNAMIEEWIKRGYNNTMKIYHVPESVEFPEWIGDNRLHRSHRMNLLRKDYKHYSRFFKSDVSGDYENYPYYWATS
tara:strand:- start:1502 stop:1921 length:420 start_codon:yes stop_codon:yes gene_type:complete